MQEVFGEWFLKRNTETMCFTNTCLLALLFSSKQSLVSAGCPGAVSSFAASFFLSCVGGQQLLRRLVKWLFAIALGSLLFALLQSSPSFTWFILDHVDTSHTAFAHTQRG